MINRLTGTDGQKRQWIHQDKAMEVYSHKEAFLTATTSSIRQTIVAHIWYYESKYKSIWKMEKYFGITQFTTMAKVIRTDDSSGKRMTIEELGRL